MLVHAAYWMDDGLQAYMRTNADTSLPRAQSMLMVYLTEGVNRQVELAQRLQVSKQAIRQAIKELEAKNMVRLVKDPDNGRYKVVELTDRGRALGVIAQAGLANLEDVLIKRIGTNRHKALRMALQAPWGEPPEPVNASTPKSDA